MGTLQSLFDQVAARCLQEAQGLYGSRLVAFAVFGSVGRRTAGPQSDLDILIVAEDLPRGRLARVQEFDPAEEALRPDLAALAAHGVEPFLSAIFRTPREIEDGSPLLLDMTEDARILYDRDHFLAKRLERLRGRLRELGARRVRFGGAWYWVLKEDFRPGEVFEI